MLGSAAIALTASIDSSHRRPEAQTDEGDFFLYASILVGVCAIRGLKFCIVEQQSVNFFLVLLRTGDMQFLSASNVFTACSSSKIRSFSSAFDGDFRGESAGNSDDGGERVLGFDDFTRAGGDFIGTSIWFSVRGWM